MRFKRCDVAWLKSADDTASHRSRTVRKEMPFWMASMSISQRERSLGTMPNPAPRRCTAMSASQTRPAKRSVMVVPSALAPRKSVRLCCGSASMQSTLFPRCRSSAARLTVVVVFAVPPFRLIIAIVLMMSSCFYFLRFPRFCFFTGKYAPCSTGFEI